MGDILRIKCKTCGLFEEELYIGCGSQHSCSEEAYCPECERIYGAKMDDRPAKFRCPKCKKHFDTWTQPKELGDQIISIQTPERPFEAICPKCNQQITLKMGDLIYPKPRPPRCAYDRKHFGVVLDFEKDSHCPRCKTGTLEITQVGLWD